MRLPLERFGKGPLSGDEAALGILFDQRNSAVHGLEGASPETLARLLRLTYRYVRREDDREHEGSYQPDRRDNAESARNRILTALLQTRGEAAYRCMADLAADPAFSTSQHRFVQLTRRMAELDAESPPWLETDFVAFSERLDSPIRTGSELLDLSCGIIDDLSASFQRGDFSPRALLETAEAEFAVQEFLAYHLEQAAHAR